MDELYQVIEWLTGFDKSKLEKIIDEKITFETFFERATLNPNAEKITGLICGYRIEEIQNPLTKKARYLDKLIDELAKGKKNRKNFKTKLKRQKNGKTGIYQFSSERPSKVYGFLYINRFFK